MLHRMAWFCSLDHLPILKEIRYYQYTNNKEREKERERERERTYYNLHSVIRPYSYARVCGSKVNANCWWSHVFVCIEVVLLLLLLLEVWMKKWETLLCFYSCLVIIKWEVLCVSRNNCRKSSENSSKIRWNFAYFLNSLLWSFVVLI